ncbi:MULTISPECIES: autotransporter domain-containing protein [unclassified Rhizobium]|uniref:autotransporter domain-containing protein n=1 Tax=unclassified Rhizobium TaxID=2613769 RepID=UPI002479E831|nr:MULTISPECIES: autotransporter domain-containing protein [unclassified Rhizobium]
MASTAAHAQEAGFNRIVEFRDAWYKVLFEKVIRKFPEPGSWAAEADRLGVNQLKTITGPRQQLAGTDSEADEILVYGKFATNALGQYAASNAVFDNAEYKKLVKYVNHAGAAFDPKKNRLRAADFILKDYFDRGRPWGALDSDGNYIPGRHIIRGDQGYPSGHTWEGYQQAQTLSLIFPERGQELFSRAIQYGESRVILKAHFPTDTIAAQTAAYFTLSNVLNDDEIVGDIAASSRAVRQKIGNLCGTTLRQCLETQATPLYDEQANAGFSIGYYNQRRTDGDVTLEPKHFNKQSGQLLRLRFPYLSVEDRRDIIAGTAYPANSLAGWNIDLNDDQSTWGLINLPAAYDGPAKLYRDITVQQTAGKFDDIADFGTWDIWKNDISGPGRLTKAGDGTLVLAGDNSFGGFTLNQGKLVLDGKNKLSGNSIVAGGDLVINGELLSDLEIMRGGQMSGKGKLSKMIVGNGGVVAPGNSIGTLSTTSIEFRPGSTYNVEVNARGQHDAILASGQATISGGTVNVIAEKGAYAPSTNHTILKADGGLVRGGASNGFDAVIGQYAFLTPSLSYDPTSVYLRLDASMCRPGSTGSQCSVGRAIETLGSGNTLYDSILWTDVANGNRILDNLSGGIYDAAQTALIMNSVHLRDAINDRMLPGGDTSNDQAGWMTSWGHAGRLNGDSGTKTVSNSGWGVLAGLDGTLGDDLTVGFVTGYEQSRVTDDQKSRVAVDAYHFGMYAAAEFDAIKLRLGGTYSYLDSEARRELWIPGLAGKMRGEMNGWQYQIFGEASTDIIADAKQTISPYVSLAHVGVDLGGLRETGGIGALDVRDSVDNVTFATLGVRGKVKLETEMNAFFTGGFGYTHAFGETDGAKKNAFAGTGANFQSSGASVAKNAAILDAALNLEVAEQNTVSLGYRGEFAKEGTNNAVNLRWDVKF